MSYVRQSRGMGFAPGYAAIGYCPGTNLPNYMSFPDGSLHCVTDAEMIQMALSSTPGAKMPTGAAPSGSPAQPPASNDGVSQAGVQSYIDSAMSWVKENPLLAAGIAVGVVLVVRG